MHHALRSFPSVFGMDTSINPKNIIQNLIFQNIGITEQVGHNRSMIIRFLASPLKCFKPRITGALSNNNKKVMDIVVICVTSTVLM